MSHCAAVGLCARGWDRDLAGHAVEPTGILSWREGLGRRRAMIGPLYCDGFRKVAGDQTGQGDLRRGAGAVAAGTQGEDDWASGAH